LAHLRAKVKLQKITKRSEKIQSHLVLVEAGVHMDINKASILSIFALITLGVSGQGQVMADLGKDHLYEELREAAGDLKSKPLVIDSFRVTPAELELQIVRLTAAVTALRSQLVDLQKQISANQVADTSQSASLAAVQRQVTLIAQNPALALGPFVTVNPNPENNVIGPNISFHGANIHIESGSGATDDHGNLSGLGNLFIGYDELAGNHGGIYSTDLRSGSHNLIVGRYHSYANTVGCFIAGYANSIENSIAGQYAEADSILGGSGNLVEAQYAGTVVGGWENLVTNGVAVAVGGEEAVVGDSSVVLGGYDCNASGLVMVTLGGYGANKTIGGNFTVNSFSIPAIVSPTPYVPTP
jgi:hypothetical protein